MPVQKQETAIKMRPYHLGVALSGGGARGFAHAGALKAIEEAGLKPDIIAGVSAGSIVAVLMRLVCPRKTCLNCSVNAHLLILHHCNSEVAAFSESRSSKTS